MRKKIILFFLLLTLFFNIVFVTGIPFTDFDNGYSTIVKEGTKYSFSEVTAGTGVIIIDGNNDANWGNPAIVFIYIVNYTNIQFKFSGTEKENTTLSPGLYVFVGYSDSSRNTYVYVYGENGSLVYNTDTLGNQDSSSKDVTIVANDTMYKYTYYQTTDFLSGQKALEVYNTYINPALKNTGQGNLTIIYGNFTGNQPITFDIYYNDSWINQFTWGGGISLHTLHLIFGDNTVTIKGKVNGIEYNLTWGNKFIINGENIVPYQETEENTTSETGVTYWFNATVSPSDYLIKVLNYSSGETLKEGTGSVSVQVPNNTKISVEIWGDGVKKLGSYYTVTHDMNISYVFKQPSNEYYNVTINVKGTDGTNIVKSTICFAGRCVKCSDSSASFLVREGSYTLSVTKSGYKPFYGTVYINGNTTLDVVLVAEEKENLSSGIGQSVPSTTNETKTFVNNTETSSDEQPSGEYYGFRIVNLDDSPHEIKIDTVIMNYNVIGGVWTVTRTLDSFTIAKNTTYVKYYTYNYLEYLGFTKVVGFTIYADGRKIDDVSSSSCRNTLYTVKINLEGFGWGEKSKGTSDLNGLITTLLPVIIIVAILGLMRDAVKRR